MAAVENVGDAVPDRTLVTVALMLAMAVAALEQTVVSTAMPSIIASLKGLDTYPWVLSAYLLASTVATPIYGKLSDLVGRKRVLLFGLGLFSLGSMLSGLARSMPELIGMRAIQGLGAGAVAPIVITMIADLYTLKERAKIQGLFSGIWGVSSIAGPTLGGFLTDYLSWRWVFFVTVPFGVISSWILLEEGARGGRSLGCLAARLDRCEPAGRRLVGLDAGRAGGERDARLGDRRPPGDGRRAGRRVRLPGAIARPTRSCRWTCWPAARSAGPSPPASRWGPSCSDWICSCPCMSRACGGGPASEGGRSIMPLFLAWAISVTVAAKLVVRFGFRATATFGSALITFGTMALALGAGHPESSAISFAAGMFVTGLGMGPTMLSYTLGVQNAVDWNQRGVATGALTFFRTFGAALGVALLGRFLGLGLASRLAAMGIKGVDVSSALRPESHKLLSAEQLHAVRQALGGPLVMVFEMLVVLSVIGLLCGLRLRGGRPVQRVESQGSRAQDDALAMLAAEGA